MKKKSIATIALILGLLFVNSESLRALEYSRISIHGFLSQGYLKSTEYDYLDIPTKNGSFAYNETGINFSGSLNDKLWLGIQVLARDFGKAGNLHVKLDWANGDYHWKDWLGVRFGKVKLPMGLYNEGRDADMLRTPILLPQAIYSDRMREMTNTYLGGGIYGVIADPFGGDVEYQLFGGVMDLDSAIVLRDFILKGVAGNMPQSADVTLHSMAAENKYTLGASMIWNTPVQNLRLGVTGFTADSSVEGELIGSFSLVEVFPILQITSQFPVTVKYKTDYSFVVSAEWTVGNFTLIGEYFTMANEMGVGLDLGIPGMPTVMTIDREQVGFYGQIGYRFFEWLELGTYYSVYYPDAGDKKGQGHLEAGDPDYLAWQRDLSLFFRFDINPYWLIKIEAHLMDGIALTEVFGDMDDQTRYWGLFGIKTTLNF